MQAKRVLSGLLISSALLLVGCSETEDSSQANQVKLSKVENLMDGKQEGFLLILKEEDGDIGSYQNKLDSIAKKNEVPINIYNTFQPDAKKIVDRANFEYTSTLQGERLYYVSKGKIKDKLNINRLTDETFTNTVNEFVTNNK
ncbi:MULTISPECIES: hypothetical protein [Exiguobacterium]|uniref:Lipoprotein n=2 Tax=Bacteria TaxID=2 RepID=A0A724WUL9_SALEP|nr:MULTISPECIES: hypothetical protein [Exiguobacterium]QWB31857.1 hypothetical protein KKI46_16550 [Exiguobacterium acetylicum]HAE0521331.1 hypothetical protein [Salmonella enterica subsp. enterica serovar Enteritidis str. P125109]